MNGLLVVREFNGRPFHCYTSSSDRYTEPIRDTLVWKLLEMDKETAESFKEPIQAQYHNGIVSAYDPRYCAGQRTLRYSLPGDKKADVVESVPIPRPKVKSEVRWAGKWEKYLKTKGWVAA